MNPSQSEISAEEQQIDRLFREKQLRESLMFTRIGLVLYLFILPVFIYIELVITHMPVNVVVLRVLPVIPAVIFLIAGYTFMKKNLFLMKSLYGITLTSLLIMMLGIVYQVQDIVVYQRYFGGVLLTTFLMFIAAVYGYRFLLMTYLFPITIFFIAMFIAYPHQREYRLIAFVNPVVAAGVFCGFSWFLARLRYREFSARNILEIRNREIKEANDQIQHELLLAKTIQEKLIPENIPQFESVHFSYQYISLGAVGGDFFDIIKTDKPDEIALFISDVAGHGVPAALITSMLKTVIETSETICYSPSLFMQTVNEKIAALNTGRHFTAFYGRYNTITRTFTCARGGHPYPVIIRENDIFELKGAGRYMGIDPGLSFEEKTIQLQKGDRLIFFTDGYCDSRNP